MTIPKKKMKKPVRRAANGQFLECGNPDGAPKKVKIDPSLPMSRRRVISNAVDRIVPVVIKGRRPEDDQVVEMSIFEACIYRLGILGASGNRVAANNLVQLAVSNSIAAQNLAMWEANLRRKIDNPLRQMSNEELLDSLRDVRLARMRDFEDAGNDDENDPETHGEAADPLDE